MCYCDLGDKRLEKIIPQTRDIQDFSGGAMLKEEMSGEVNRLLQKYKDPLHWQRYITLHPLFEEARDISVRTYSQKMW